MSYLTDSFDEKVVELLKHGGVGLLPSDTIYGISCMALEKEAVERVHKLKSRDSNKPFIVLISDVKMLDLLSISKVDAKSVNQYWPGPLSVVFPALNAPEWLQLGTKTLAVRLPNKPDLLSLISKVGPIVSTSSNLQGEQPASSEKEAQQIFGDKLDFYVDVGKLDNPPSTLAVIENGKLKVVRQGAVKIR